MKNNCLKILLSFLFASLFSQISGAQGVSLSESRQFNISIIRAIDEYERVCSFSEPDDRRTFLRLFEKPGDDCVYNDLMGKGQFQAMLSPKAYQTNLPDDGTVLLQTSIRDIRKEGDIFLVDGVLHRRVSLTKYVMMIDASVYSGGEGGVLFDSSQLFKDAPDFRLVFDFAYYPEDGVAKIASIVCEDRKETSPFDEDKFSVVLKPEEKYEKLMVSDGKQLEFNEFGQSITSSGKIDVNSGDVIADCVEVASGDNYNVLDFKFRYIRMRAKIYAETTLGNAFGVKSSYAGMTYSSSAFQTGADLGIESSLKDHWRLGIYAGAAINMSNLNLYANNVSYSYNVAGGSGTTMTREYEFSASESIKLTDIVAPVYLESEIDIIPRLMLSIDLGAKFYLNRKTDLKPYVVNGTFGGQSVSQEYTAFISPADYTRKSFDISLYGKLELDVCIVKRLLYFYVGYSYEMGLNPIYDSGSQTYFSKKDQVYPFVYSFMTGKDIPYRSLVGSTVYQRKANWLSAGLKFKF